MDDATKNLIQRLCAIDTSAMLLRDERAVDDAIAMIDRLASRPATQAVAAKVKHASSLEIMKVNVFGDPRFNVVLPESLAAQFVAEWEDG